MPGGVGCDESGRRADKRRLDSEFTELYRAHLRDVYSYSYYRVGNHHDAEDLTEQTFLQAYRHFERAQRESNGRPLRPWLIRIAHNLAANYYRDRSRRPQTQLEDAAVVSAPHDTEDLVEGREELKDVLAGVAKLPDDRREALIMRFALGMDNREIARALGPLRGRDQGADPPGDQAARAGAQGGRPPMAEMSDVEALLRSALVPVEPSEALSDRLERTLSEITDLAVDELADWELSAMRDPRNWGPHRRRPWWPGARPPPALVVLSARAPAQAQRAGDPLARARARLREVSSDLRSRLGR